MSVASHMPYSVDEFLALDLLTLRAHTERSGDVLDAEQQRARIEASLSVSQVCIVRRSGALVAYAMFRPESEGAWFVTGFNTHPSFRTSTVLFELLASLVDRVRTLDIRVLRSNVYKANDLSMSFHRRLGFRVTRENEKGVEFTARSSEIAASPAIARTAKRLGLGS